MPAVNGYETIDVNTIMNVATSTIPNHIREVEDAVTQEQVLFALVRNNGNITYNHGGTGITWLVKNKFLQTSDGGARSRSFPEVNNRNRAALGWGGMHCGASLSGDSQRKNSGIQQVVPLIQEYTEAIIESIENNLSYIPYIDGESAGSQGWHGLKTLFRTDGTINIGLEQAVKRAANNADPIGYCVGNYARISKELGAYGGANDVKEGARKSWPFGTSDPAYDFWTPLVVNYNSDLFSDDNTWKSGCESALSFAMTYYGGSGLANNAITHFLMSPDLYVELKDAMRDRIRHTTSPGVATMHELGFPGVLEFDGTVVIPDEHMPPGEVYGFNLNNIEVRCIGQDLINPEPTFWDGDNDMLKSGARVDGQFKFKAGRNFVALKPKVSLDAV